jgi:hypothetical protein
MYWGGKAVSARFRKVWHGLRWQFVNLPAAPDFHWTLSM